MLLSILLLFFISNTNKGIFIFRFFFKLKNLGITIAWRTNLKSQWSWCFSLKILINNLTFKSWIIKIILSKRTSLGELRLVGEKYSTNTVTVLTATIYLVLRKCWSALRALSNLMLRMSQWAGTIIGSLEWGNWSLERLSD